jgi:hypothetical protein
LALNATDPLDAGHRCAADLAMPVEAVADTHDWAAGSARVPVKAVLHGVPGEGRRGQIFGGCVNLARPQRAIGAPKYFDHGILNSAGATRDLALRQPFRGASVRRHERPSQSASVCEPLAVQTCSAFFHPL